MYPRVDPLSTFPSSSPNLFSLPLSLSLPPSQPSLRGLEWSVLKATPSPTPPVREQRGESPHLPVRLALGELERTGWTPENFGLVTFPIRAHTHKWTRIFPAPQKACSVTLGSFWLCVCSNKKGTDQLDHLRAGHREMILKVVFQVQTTDSFLIPSPTKADCHFGPSPQHTPHFFKAQVFPYIG